MNTLPADHSMAGFIRDEIKNTRSQDLPKNYRLNGAIYICRTDLLMKENTFFIDDNIFAYIMNNNVSVDIDDFSGFLLAKTYIDHSST
jgi:CMP-N-acetylneuraminic acid synthetase